MWLALGQGDYQFSLTSRIQLALQGLAKQEFIQFLEKLLAADYDVLFLATDPAPVQSYVKTMNKNQLIEKLRTN
ncbi:hypothetical protein [Alishewanella longhuensis]